MSKLGIGLVVFLALAGVAAWAAGLLDPDADRYPLSLDETRARLMKTRLPPSMETCRADTAAPRSDRVEWSVFCGQAPFARFVADLAADEGGTRVAVHFGDDAGRLAAHPAAVHFFVEAMREQIASTIWERRFNFFAIYGAMALVYLTDPDMKAQPVGSFQEPAQPLR